MTKLEELQLKVSILNLTTPTEWWLTTNTEGIIVLCCSIGECHDPETPWSKGFDSINISIGNMWKERVDAGKQEILMKFLRNEVSK